MAEVRGGAHTNDARGGSQRHGSSWRAPLLELRRRHAPRLVFAVGLFGCLATTTVLLDNWGPHLFQRLLAPTSAELPHALLLLLSAGDLAGILLSILIVDKVGRRGCLHLGFFGQAALYVLMALAPRRAAPLAALGFAATGCRCFGWEAAQIWVVEAFPTTVRATALGLCSTAMRLLSIATLGLSAAGARDVEPTAALLTLAALLTGGGLYATLLPMETAGSRLAGDEL